MSTPRNLIRMESYGLVVDHTPGFELVFIHHDEKLGRWLILKAGRQEVEVRITKTGLLRVSKPRPAGVIGARGAQS